MLEPNFVRWAVDGSWVHIIAKTHVRCASRFKRLDKPTMTNTLTHSHTHTHTHIHTYTHSYAMDATTPGNGDAPRRSTRVRRDSHHIIEQQQEQEAWAERVMSNHRIGDSRRHRHQREDIDGVTHDQWHDQHTKEGHRWASSGGGGQGDSLLNTRSSTTISTSAHKPYSA